MRLKLRSVVGRFLPAVLWVAVGLRQPASDVVINEIMYHPVSQNENEEWVELYNTASTTATLSGWRFIGAITYLFPPGTQIGPDGYLVVAKSIPDFQALYTTSTADVIGGYTGQLGNGGEAFLLYDNLVQQVDSVAYDDEGHWPTAADGDGPSLELINPALDNAIPQSWAAGTVGGTPGLPNSQFAADPAPFVVLPIHSPAVPRPTDWITVSARVFDESAIARVDLYYRADETTGPFSTIPMLDNGGNGDALPGDGVYGAIIPQQPRGTILEFWIQAEDSSAQTIDFPPSAPTENMLLQVDNETFDVDRSPYRVVMKAADHEELHTRNPWSNVLLNATFIRGSEIWYNVGVRFRGKGSRNQNRVRKSYRIQFTEQEPFGEIENLNLNAQYIRCQALNMDLCQRAGIPAPDTQFAYLIFKYHDKNTHLEYDGDPVGEPDLEVMGWRVQMQDTNRDYLRKWFPGNSNGNLYRGVYCAFDRQADFTYLGPDKNIYRCPYEKKTNETQDDFSDVIELCDIFTFTTDTLFTSLVQDYVDVPEWMRYGSCMAMISIDETQIWTTRGDDYFLYFDPATSPPLPTAHLLPWDLDESNINPYKTIWLATRPNVQRVSQNPDFTPRYFRYIQDLLDDHYTAEIMIPKVEATAPYGGFEVLPGLRTDTIPIDDLTNYVHERIAYLEGVISRELVVNVPGTARVGGEYVAVYPTIYLNGRGETAWTRWVTVDGFDAGYEHLTGNWGDYRIDLQPGLNTNVVECLTTAGVAISTETVTIRYGTSPTLVCGTLTGDETWTAAGSPYHLTCDVVVPDGLTLTIGPGTAVLLDPGVSLYVLGTLTAVGTATDPITFSPASGGSVPETLVPPGAIWRFDDTGTDLGSSWTAPGYDDAAWTSGPAELGYGDGDEATTVSTGPDPFVNSPCYYFRHEFDVADPNDYRELLLDVIRDDGIVVYLNGSELARDNMATGPVTFDTWAASRATTLSGENEWKPLGPVDTFPLVSGPNVIAAEVHQFNATSSDLSFDLHLAGALQDPSWGVIGFNGADGPCQLVNCVFSGGSTAGAYRGMVSVAGSTVDIVDCRFSSQGYFGVHGLNGSGLLTVRNCYFEQNDRTAIQATDTPVMVEGSTFLRRTQTGGRAIWLSGLTDPPSQIIGNDILGGASDLVGIEDANVSVSGNLIRAAGEAALQIGSGSQVTCDHNLILDSRRGIVVRNGATALIDHNTLYGNATGIECEEDGAAPGSGGGEATLVNTIVWATKNSVAVDAASMVTITYSDIEDGFSGTGNFFLDPAFVAAGFRDLRIQNGSPCADGGENGTYVGAFPALPGPSEVRHWEIY